MKAVPAVTGHWTQMPATLRPGPPFNTDIFSIAYGFRYCISMAVSGMESRSNSVGNANAKPNKAVGCPLNVYSGV